MDSLILLASKPDCQYLCRRARTHVRRVRRTEKAPATTKTFIRPPYMSVVEKALKALLVHDLLFRYQITHSVRIRYTTLPLKYFAAQGNLMGEGE
jgi:hypothetical protein